MCNTSVINVATKSMIQCINDSTDTDELKRLAWIILVSKQNLQIEQVKKALVDRYFELREW